MRKVGMRIAAGLLAIGMAMQSWGAVPLKAVTYNKIVEITKDEQVVDSYRGVDAVYRKNAYETELPWNCAGYVRSFYQAIYGVNVTNLFRGQIPNGNKDGKYVEFVQVKAPKTGDICGEVKTSSNHWTIVRKVMGETIVVIEQNYKWMEGDKVYCQINRKINYKEGDYRFYRLASKTKSNELVSASSSSETTTKKVTEKSTKKTTAKTTKKKTEKTTAKKTEKKTEKPTVKKTEKKTEKPTVKKTEKKTEKTTVKKTEKKTEKTTVKKTEKKTEKPTVKKTEKKTEKPTVKKTEKKTEKTTEKKAAKEIVSNITEVSLNPKASVTLSVTYKESGKKPKTVVYSSNNKTIADVSGSGNVTAKKPGSAVITMVVDGAKTSCIVKVNGSADSSSKKTTEKTTAKTTKKSSEKTTEKTIKKSTEKTTAKTTKKPTQKATEKSTQKPTEKTAKKTKSSRKK